MFDDYAELRKVKEVATILAHDTDWAQLYDEGKLAENTVPVFAATYIEDMWAFAISVWLRGITANEGQKVRRLRFCARNGRQDQWREGVCHEYNVPQRD